MKVFSGEYFFLLSCLCLCLAGCDDSDSDTAAVLLGGGPGGTSEPQASPIPNASGSTLSGELGVSQPLSGVLVTNYGYAGDYTPDSASAAGIGNHDNTLTGYLNSGTVASAALSNDVAANAGIALGQEFQITTSDGSTFLLKYDDTAPESGRVDVYAPSGNLGGNNFSAKALYITPINQGTFK